MPPAVSDDDASSVASSVADIPPRKTDKKKGKVVPEEAPEDDDESLDADEYIVEKIKSHRFETDGTIKYEVKWQGFGDKDNTWEPEENLTGCVDDLEQYFTKIGGKPKIPEPKSKGTPASAKSGTKKRNLSHGSSAEISTPDTTSKVGKGRQKKTKLDGATSNSGTPPTKAKWEPPSGSWEDHVINIDTMEKDPIDGTISAFIMWADGHRSLHPSKVVHQKCPQKMLQFYEAHLQFNIAPVKPDPEPPRDVKVDEKEDELGEEGSDIKGVASSIANGIKGVASTLAENFRSIA